MGQKLWEFKKQSPSTVALCNSAAPGIEPVTKYCELLKLFGIKNEYQDLDSRIKSLQDQNKDKVKKREQDQMLLVMMTTTTTTTMTTTMMPMMRTFLLTERTKSAAVNWLLLSISGKPWLLIVTIVIVKIIIVKIIIVKIIIVKIIIVKIIIVKIIIL